LNATEITVLLDVPSSTLMMGCALIPDYLPFLIGVIIGMMLMGVLIILLEDH
jgi:hypothetical protein